MNKQELRDCLQKLETHEIDPKLSLEFITASDNSLGNFTRLLYDNHCDLAFKYNSLVKVLKEGAWHLTT